MGLKGAGSYFQRAKKKMILIKSWYFSLSKGLEESALGTASSLKLKMSSILKVQLYLSDAMVAAYSVV